MNSHSKPRILLGVSGGIAAYKSAELVRRMRDGGAEVRVVMTHSAQAFITPLTLQALSGHPVHSEVLDAAAEAAMGHIELARWAELVLVAPATAHLLARVAHGLADDLLTTLCLTTTAPLVLAPAMNQQMWQAPATRRNTALLGELGVELWGPAAGMQACGEVGPGRLLEPEQLAQLALRRVRRALDASGQVAEVAGAAMAAVGRSAPLQGQHVLITAGPTREAIDPVRYISNHSSGKMGYAVAAVARNLGARVTLVSGPTALAVPAGVDAVTVVSARQMYDAVMRRVADAQVFVAAAAVADYAPVAPASAKMKKSEPSLHIELERTEDILAAVAALRPAPFTVGFAAETSDLEHYARDKLTRKGLDMIAANEVGDGRGFDVDVNALSVFWPGGGEHIGLADKQSVAAALWALIVARMQAARPGGQPMPRAPGA